jgi:hypothetical protein
MDWTITIIPKNCADYSQGNDFNNNLDSTGFYWKFKVRSDGKSLYTMNKTNSIFGPQGHQYKIIMFYL